MEILNFVGDLHGYESDRYRESVFVCNIRKGAAELRRPFSVSLIFFYDPLLFMIFCV